MSLPPSLGGLGISPGVAVRMPRGPKEHEALGLAVPRAPFVFKSWEWSVILKQQLPRPGDIPFDVSVNVELTFLYYNIEERRKKGRGDLDNLAKPVIDAMTGLGWWRDDFLLDGLLLWRKPAAHGGVSDVLMVAVQYSPQPLRDSGVARSRPRSRGIPAWKR